jgi:hypothetical protein
MGDLMFRAARARLRRLILFALLQVAATTAAQPVTFSRETLSVDIAGYVEDVDVYRPADQPSLGVAIVAHGFTRSRIRHKDLGQALAKVGVTAVIPDLPNVMDLWGNGDAIVDLVRKLEAGTLGDSPVASAQVVLIGTSAGGLATVLAASRLPGIAGWIGLDPVDRTGTGTDAAAQVNAPSIVLLAGASSCNLFGSGRNIARALPNLLRTIGWKDASHCDFEDPTNNFCRVLCGKSSPQMQQRIRRETVNGVLEMLRLSATANSPPLLAPDSPDPVGPPEPSEVPSPPAAADSGE